MSTSEFVRDVSQDDFQREVLDRSSEVPVVVDFWAEWCGPCKALGPVLEELAAEAGGRWVLAKVNSDESPDLSAAYGIRGIPHVIGFVDGVAVDNFTGALPQAEVAAFINRLVPSEADRLAREAAEAAAAGDPEREADVWNRVLAADPSYHVARVRRARLRLAAGDAAGAREDLELVPEESEFRTDAENLLRFAEWGERVRERGGAEAVRERAAAEPELAEARFDFGCALAVAGNFEGGLAEFLEVVRRDRSFEEDAGRKAMVALFSILGDEDSLTVDFRHRLSMELY